MKKLDLANTILYRAGLKIMPNGSERVQLAWEAMVNECLPHWNERIGRQEKQLIGYVGIWHNNTPLTTEEHEYLVPATAALVAVKDVWKAVRREGVEVVHNHQIPNKGNVGMLFRILYAPPPPQSPYWKTESVQAFQALWDDFTWTLEPDDERRIREGIEKRYFKTDGQRFQLFGC